MPFHPRAILGVCAALALGLCLGLVDGRPATGTTASRVGSVTGSVLGADRYRVVLTPIAPATPSPSDHVVEGRGRFFRDDAVPPGRYRVSVIVDPDSARPRLLVLLALPHDAQRLDPASPEYGRVAAAIAELERAARSGAVEALEPFFDERFRGPSGQTRAEQLARASAAAASTQPERFEIAIDDAFRAGERWFVRLRYSGAYHARQSGELQTFSSAFVSELRETATGFRFLTTDTVALPGLRGVQSLAQQFVPAGELATVLVRSGTVAAFPRAIVVDAATLTRERVPD